MPGASLVGNTPPRTLLDGSRRITHTPRPGLALTSSGTRVQKFAERHQVLPSLWPGGAILCPLKPAMHLSRDLSVPLTSLAERAALAA